MNCLIVQSKFSEFSFWNYTEVCEIVNRKYPSAPLGLITMAALMPQEWNFKLIDENVEELTDDHFKWADFVCTGGMLPQQKGMAKVIERSKQFNLPVAVGGPDPTSQPHHYEGADFKILGEAELTIPMFLEDFNKGAKKGTYQTAELADMKKAVTPRFDLINFQNYLHVGVQFCRGCPFDCEFCDIIELYGRKPRLKSADQIIAELQSLYDLGYRGHVDFVDDNFIGNKKSVKEVLPKVIEWSKARKHPFFYTTEASINMADDEDLMQLMRDADFRYVFIGIETPDDELLKAMGKKQNVKKPIGEMIRKIYDYGMVVNAGFIMGFDNETEHTADNMIDLIEDTGIGMAMLGTLYALPNTQITRRLRKEWRLFEDGEGISEEVVDQLSSGLNYVTLRPRLDILKDYARVIKRIYTPKDYFTRIISSSILTKQTTKFKPNFKEILINIRSVYRITKKLGFNKRTGGQYWKMIFTVLFKNIWSLEIAINLAAMYIHFEKQSQYIVSVIEEQIKHVEEKGEKTINTQRNKKKKTKGKTKKEVASVN